MSGRITGTPKAQHHCSAGWHAESNEAAAEREARAGVGDEWSIPWPVGARFMIEDRPWPEPGAIWTCDECGREWKATYPYSNVFSPTWVRHRPIQPIRWPWKRR